MISVIYYSGKGGIYVLVPVRRMKSLAALLEVHHIEVAVQNTIAGKCLLSLTGETEKTPTVIEEWFKVGRSPFVDKVEADDTIAWFSMAG